MAKENTTGLGYLPDCFVIMPIGDPEGYESGHFQHVFLDIFSPACEKAGFRAVRADQVRETNLIHLDVLQKLISSPMVLCDLSSRNPNVLFELGLRQAFDKPVVLVQERGTPKIFDIAPLRYTEYRRSRIYHEVIEDQIAVARALEATRDAFNRGDGVNSIIRVLSITRPAKLTELEEASRDPALQIIRAELNELRSEIRTIFRERSQIDAVEEEENLTEVHRVADILTRIEIAARQDPENLGHIKEGIDAVKWRLEEQLTQHRNSEVWRGLAVRLADLEGYYLERQISRNRGSSSHGRKAVKPKDKSR